MTRNRILPYFTTILSRRASSTSKIHGIAPAQEAALSEKCILVNEDDCRIGSASKLDCHLVRSDGSLILHRAFSVFLFNSKGDLLLQKRAASKVTFPSHITNACCSHPLENFEEEMEESNALGVKLAARRRLHFELGIPLKEINLKDMTYLTRIHYQAQENKTWGEHEMDYILFLQRDVSLKPNPDEVSDVMYISKNNFNSYVNSLSDPLTPWFNLIIKHRLSDWWDNLSALSKFKDHTNIQRF